MSFGNTTIYPFPAVQYIPMSITTICRESITNLSSKTSTPMVIAGADIGNWEPILNSDYGINLSSTLPEGGFPILALNLRIDESRYRGFALTMTGKADAGNYHYFIVPQRYFYKTKLFFEVYDCETSALLARYSFFMPRASRESVKHRGNRPAIHGVFSSTKLR